MQKHTWRSDLQLILPHLASSSKLRHRFWNTHFIRIFKNTVIGAHLSTFVPIKITKVMMTTDMKMTPTTIILTNNHLGQSVLIFWANCKGTPTAVFKPAFISMLAGMSQYHRNDAYLAWYSVVDIIGVRIGNLHGRLPCFLLFLAALGQLHSSLVVLCW